MLYSLHYSPANAVPPWQGYRVYTSQSGLTCPSQAPKNLFEKLILWA
jgi:hypothetical protein